MCGYFRRGRRALVRVQRGESNARRLRGRFISSPAFLGGQIACPAYTVLALIVYLYYSGTGTGTF